MLTKGLTAIAMATLLSACASTSLTQTGSVKLGIPYTLSAAEQDAVKAGVTGALKDPTSAIFGLMKASQDPTGTGDITVCGYVNGKNAFGGYVGSKPFLGMIIASGQFVVAGMGGTESATIAVYTVCRQSGINLATG